MRDTKKKTGFVVMSLTLDYRDILHPSNQPGFHENKQISWVFSLRVLLLRGEGEF